MPAKNAVQLLVALSFCTLLSGCRVTENAWRSTIVEPLHYASEGYNKLAKVRFHNLANSVLAQEIATARAELDDYCAAPFSEHHELGFIDGFVDYLEAGGTGQPPALPPRRYWQAKYQNPGGVQAIQNWFSGYEHGASVASASGFRSLMTVPISDFLIADSTPYLTGQTTPTEQPANELDDDSEHRTDIPIHHETYAPVVPQSIRLPPISAMVDPQQPSPFENPQPPTGIN